MGKRRFCYYQPNKKDLKDEYGDCTIRALSKALGVTWLEAYDRAMPLCRFYQVSNVFGAPSYIQRQIIEKLGFKYHGISNKRGTSRPTVDSFTREHPEGTYIVNVAHHVVAVVDGKYYDTWDSGYKSLYGYYERISTEEQEEELKGVRRYRIGYKEQNKWNYIELIDESKVLGMINKLLSNGINISIKPTEGIKLQ